MFYDIREAKKVYTIQIRAQGSSKNIDIVSLQYQYVPYDEVIPLPYSKSTRARKRY